MIDVNKIKLNTPVLELGLSDKLLNRLKLNQISTFKQLMEVDTSKWEHVVATKVISAMRAAQDKYRVQYEKLLPPKKADQPKQPACPTPEISSDPQLDGQAYSQMTNTAFAVPSTYDQRRFFVANNILNAYVLSGRLQDEEGPLPLVMREIVKVADAFMDAFDGKPYVEEEDEEDEEEIIIPIPTVETPAAPQKQESQKKQDQQKKQQESQKQENSKKQNNSKKKDKAQKQQNQKKESQPQDEPKSEELQETIDEILEAPVSQEIPIEIIDVIDDEQGLYNPEVEEYSEFGQPNVPSEQVYEYDYDSASENESNPESNPESGSETEFVEAQEVIPASPTQPNQPTTEVGGFDAQHPNAERGQQIKIVKYLGRGKRGSKYFQEGDDLVVKRMRKGDDGVIVVSATINDKNVCFDSKHYTWSLD